MNSDQAHKLVDYSDTSSEDEKQRMTADSSLFKNACSSTTWSSPFITRQSRKLHSVRKATTKMRWFRDGTTQPATPQPSRIFPNLVRDHIKIGIPGSNRTEGHRPRNSRTLFPATEFRSLLTCTEPHANSHHQTPITHPPSETHTSEDINSNRSLYTPQPPQTNANKSPFTSVQKPNHAPNAPIKATIESKWKQAAFAMRLEESECEKDHESAVNVTHTWGFTTPCKSTKKPWKLSSSTQTAPQTPSKAKNKTQKVCEGTKNVETLKSDFCEFHIEKPQIASPFISKEKNKYTPIGISSNRKKACRQRYREIALLERQKRREEFDASQPFWTSLNSPHVSCASSLWRKDDSVSKECENPQRRPPDSTHRQKEAQTLHEYDWSFWKHLGNTAYSSGNYEDAIRYYRQSLEALESSLALEHSMHQNRSLMKKEKGSLHANLSASLMMTSSLTEARHEILYAIAVDPLHLRSYLRLARIQIMLGYCEEAKKTVSNMKALFWIGRIQQDAGGSMIIENETSIGSETKHQEAINEIETSITKYQEACDKARQSQALGSYVEALCFWDQCLHIAPQDRQSLIEKTTVLLHLRRFEDVFRVCEERLQQSKVCASLNDLLNTLRESEFLCNAIKILGRDQSILWAKALCYTNRSEDAFRVLDTIEMLAPCCTKVLELKRAWVQLEKLNEQGNVAFRRQAYESAIHIYTDAIRTGDSFHHEKLASVYSNRAAAAMSLKQYAIGVSDCTEALKLHPKHLRALLRRARCYVYLEKYQLAISDFDSILAKWSWQDVASIGTKSDLNNERLDVKNKLYQWERENKNQSANKSTRNSNRSNKNHFNGNWRKNKNTRRFSHANQSRGRKTSDQWSFPQENGWIGVRRSHYEILGVSRTASVADIRKTYMKLALQFHPGRKFETSLTVVTDVFCR